MGMTAPAACLLLSQYVPASARLFAEFQRLRDSLPAADARTYFTCECANKHVRPAEMRTTVRLCAWCTSGGSRLTALRTRGLQRHASCISIRAGC